MVCFAAQSVCAGIHDSPSRRIKGNFTGYVYCSGLRSPDGLAFHPTTGELYVSEEVAGRISVIRDHEPVTVIQDEFEVVGAIPSWAITSKKPEIAWRESRIHSPEGIAFTAQGHLLVTEDVPNGRLLEFIPGRDGRFSQARVHPVPWLDNQSSWEGVTVAKDGRIFISGSTENSGPGLFFGTVLMREPSGSWWVVDYGPFNSFSSVALSRDEDILVVGDSVTGSVNWWDTVRHDDIGVATGIVTEIEGVCVLPDGAILAAQESTSALQMNPFHNTATPGVKGGKLVYLNPETGESFVAASGFGTIESVAVDPASGYVYVTEDSSGKIYQLRPNEPWDTTHYALQRTVRTYENSKGIAPKTWPPFLKQFFGRMGLQTRDEQVAGQTGEPGKTFTLKEFAERVPLIAGRFQTKEKDHLQDPDPVVEVDFVSFFPGKVVKSQVATTPSLSLFSARHKSGKVERTRVMGDMKMYGHGLNEQNRATSAQSAFMLIPMVSCAAVNTEQGLDINMAFMGMGSAADYFLQIPGGQAAKGVFYRDRGQSGKSKYEASFIEKLQEGSEIHNLVVAGFEAPRDDRLYWYEIGRLPVSTILSLDPKARWIPRAFRAGGAELMALLEQQQEEDQLFAGEGFDSDRIKRVQTDRDYYIPTVSLEHKRGSLEVGNQDADLPDGKKHAHQGRQGEAESAGVEAPDLHESAGTEVQEELESVGAGPLNGSDETAGFQPEAAYWELALYNRAIEAWTAID